MERFGGFLRIPRVGARGICFVGREVAVKAAALRAPGHSRTIEQKASPTTQGVNHATGRTCPNGVGVPPSLYRRIANPPLHVLALRNDAFPQGHAVEASSCVGLLSGRG